MSYGLGKSFPDDRTVSQISHPQDCYSPRQGGERERCEVDVRNGEQAYSKNSQIYMGNEGYKGNQDGGQKKKAGYEYLLAYKLTVPIYDYTVEFCARYIPSNSRTRDQMVQAARSGMQNILEGNQQEGMKGYIKLCGIARGSLEELLKDYESYARQHRIVCWERDRVSQEVPELEQVWTVLRATPTLPDHPNFPNLPDSPEKTVNLMITLIHQANYLIDKLVVSLKDKHMREGGLTEELYRKRVEYRKSMGQNQGQQ